MKHKLRNISTKLKDIPSAIFMFICDIIWDIFYFFLDVGEFLEVFFDTVGVLGVIVLLFCVGSLIFAGYALVVTFS